MAETSSSLLPLHLQQSQLDEHSSNFSQLSQLQPERDVPALDISELLLGHIKEKAVTLSQEGVQYVKENWMKKSDLPNQKPKRNNKHKVKQNFHNQMQEAMLKHKSSLEEICAIQTNISDTIREQSNYTAQLQHRVQILEELVLQLASHTINTVEPIKPCKPNTSKNMYVRPTRTAATLRA